MSAIEPGMMVARVGWREGYGGRFEVLSLNWAGDMVTVRCIASPADASYKPGDTDSWMVSDCEVLEALQQ